MLCEVQRPTENDESETDEEDAENPGEIHSIIVADGQFVVVRTTHNNIRKNDKCPVHDFQRT